MLSLTQQDIRLMNQYQLTYSVKVEVLQDGKIIEVLKGLIQGGTESINAESDVRRTFSIQVIPTWDNDIKVHESGVIWLNKDAHLYLGLTDIQTGEVVWYSQGYYVFSNVSANYDSQTNTLTINCNDWASKLDGSKNGQVGALTTTIPAYDIYRYYYNDNKATVSDLPHYDSETEEGARLMMGDTYLVTADNCYYVCQDDFTWKNIGTSIDEHIAKDGLGIHDVIEFVDDDDTKRHYYGHYKWTVIREAMVSVLEQLGYVENHLIDEIGDNNMMPGYTKDWEKNRESEANAEFEGRWSTVPYDQEFSAGCSVLSIITTLRDLYPNFETFFDIDGVFRCQMIPTCEDDDVVFDDDFLQRILISESTTIDMMQVRNICEIWGKVIEIDFYSDAVSYSGGTFTANIPSYETQYMNGDRIGLKMPKGLTLSSANPKININGYGVVDICHDNSDELLSPFDEEGIPVFQEEEVYVFKISKKRKDKVDTLKAYFLGRYQCHGLHVLSDGTTAGYHTFNEGKDDEKTVPKFSKEYFQTKYNCEVVEISVVPDSPFSVQKIGEILDVKSGGTYESIISNDDVLERARYENYLTSRLTDSITLTTLLVPFLDVNIKVKYRRSDETEAHEYIVKSVSHSFDAGTSSITLMRFYPYMTSKDYGNVNDGSTGIETTI